MPPSLIQPVCRGSRSNKRRKQGEHEYSPEVCLHSQVFRVYNRYIHIRQQNDIDHFTETRQTPPSLPQTEAQNRDRPDYHNPSPHQEEPSEAISTGPRLLDDDMTVAGLNSPIDELKKTARFIDALRGASLEQSNMRPQDIERLRTADPDPRLDIMDSHFIKALRVFLSTTNASQATFDAIRSSLMQCYPDDPFLSFHQVRRRVEQLSGVVPISYDMCRDTCVGFTGPLLDLDSCPICGKDRYRTGTREPHRQFITIPLGPIIQALYGSPEIAEKMHYREQATTEILDYARTHNGKVKEYNDTTCGRDYLEAVEDGRIKSDDVLVQLSLDSAQLYRDKESDCWIFVYIIHNLPPDLRYKKKFVIPAGFIPGPLKMKDGDSFLYPILYHISALQNEGLRIWDSSIQRHIPHSTPFVFVTADGPAMSMVSGMVGHSGRYGCCLYCGLPGRRRERDGHYYPAMLKPNTYDVTGCNHDDVMLSDLRRYKQDVSTRYHDNLFKLLNADNPTQFKERRLETGLCKQTIFSGLRFSLGIPNIFPLDVMHLVNLNDPDLLLGLWRGTMKVYPPDSLEFWDWRVLVGNVWQAHRKTVSLATQFIPSCFGRAPRNPAEKINSGYKAWEFQIYLIGLGPALFRHILAKEYWTNYCKYVSGIRILQKWAISPEDLQRGHHLLLEFTREFEQLYYQRRADRVHFVRQSIHLLTHIASETIRVGPLSCYSQWTIETAIGNLGEEIRQDRDPYSNVAERGVLRAQVNSVQAIFPHLHLENDNSLPRGAKDLGHGYALLRACQNTAEPVVDAEANTILKYWEQKGWPNQDKWPRGVKRWSRLRLPNGQIARSKWYESHSTRPLRKTTCVKVCNITFFFAFKANKLFYCQINVNGTTAIADIEYFFRLQFGETVHSLALVTMFSPPDEEVLRESHHAAYICHRGGTDALTVVDIKSIIAVVSMVPDYQVTVEGEIIVPENRFSLIEAAFLKSALCRIGDDDEDSNDISNECP